MKSAVALLALAIAAATPAAADQRIRLLPPEEYDHSYQGNLVLIVAKNQEEVRAYCPGTKFHPLVGALACSFRNVPTVIMVSTRLHGRVPTHGRRHEIAHCNGWPGDHKGARVFEEWVTDAPPAPSAECKECWVGFGAPVPECYEHLPRLPTSGGK